MIERAAAAGEGDRPGRPAPEPPAELALWWTCEHFRALPCAGGVLDQPAGLLRRMRTYAFAHEAMGAFWRLPQAEFEQRYPGGMQMVNFVLRYRMAGEGK